ncbi:hypothetical protein DPMN_191933 [Dreissena polymorpha]|uniref:EB domain-containing protein n=1 Tax=Dreissena polymorpha TaxID=45954 RepID=A0A9D3XYC0_DREPO|nr:hypothetical protein DPMN_191933 [Dreissena polymorpha]
MTTAIASTIATVTTTMSMATPPTAGIYVYNKYENSGHMYYYSCEDDKCQCNANIWRQENGTCVSAKGKMCASESNCGIASNTTCVSGICACKPGFLERNGACVFVLDAECFSDNDCGTSFVCNES